MITKKDVKDLRNYINTGKNIPGNIKIILDDLCSIYEDKYNLYL